MLHSSSASIAIRAEISDLRGLSRRRGDLDRQYSIDLSSSADPTPADLVHTSTRVLAASGILDLDLSNGLTDAWQLPLHPATIKAIAVLASASNAGDLLIGAASAHAFLGPFATSSSKVRLQPGGRYFAASRAGFDLAEGVSDVLRFQNASGGAPLTFDLILIGVSGVSTPTDTSPSLDFSLATNSQYIPILQDD